MPVFQEAIVSQEIFDAARGIHSGRRREDLHHRRPGNRLRPGGQRGVWGHLLDIHVAVEAARPRQR